ncbi:MAG: FAD-dependent monooxygenase [Chloroflexi bacterium]|nr:FAD-dependent monooxygenase [Chloroflexota bacterium]
MIVVIGGKLSGLTVASLLAESEQEITVLEKHSPNYPVVSIPIFFPDTLHIFDKFGFGDHLDQAGFPRIRTLSFEIYPGIRISGCIPPNLGRNWGYAIRKETLDHLLTKFVTERFKNINLVHNFSVQELHWEDGRVVGVRGRWRGNLTESVRADAVIGADGRNSTVANLVKAKIYRTLPSRTCFFYAYFSNVRQLYELPSIVTYIGSSIYPYHAFTQDADKGLVGVGIELPLSEFDLFKADLKAEFVRRLHRISGLKERLESARIESQVMGLRIPDMYYRQAFGNGWALVGDAGLLMDPITGQGFNNAVNSASWLCESLHAWRVGEDWNLALRRYEKLRDHRTKTNFERAYNSTDFYYVPEEWEIRWLKATRRRPEKFLEMVTNKMMPEKYYSRLALARAKFFHGMLKFS